MSEVCQHSCWTFEKLWPTPILDIESLFVVNLAVKSEVEVLVSAMVEFLDQGHPSIGQATDMGQRPVPHPSPESPSMG